MPNNYTNKTKFPMAIMLHLAAFVILCVVSVFGTIGNVFIIGAVCLQKTLRVRGSVFIINLAIADLIITSYIMPIGLATSQYRVNPFGETLCEINAFLILLTSGVSTQSLMMIAFERYFHICKVHWYRRIFTKHTTACLVAFTWVYSAIWTCQGWTGWTKYIYGEDVYVCILDGTVSLSYNLCLVIFGMLLPMVVLAFCYLNILWTVRSSQSNINKDKKLAREHPDDPTLLAVYKQKKKKLQREQRLIWTLFAIVIIFVVFWTPSVIVLPLSGFWEEMPKVLYTISVWTALSNSSVNSIVYGAMNKNFRRGYVALFRKLFCCCSGRKPPAYICQGGASRSHDDSASTSQSKIPSPDTSLVSPDPKASTPRLVDGIPDPVSKPEEGRKPAPKDHTPRAPANVAIELVETPENHNNSLSEETSDMRTIIHRSDSTEPIVYNEVVFVSKV